MDIYYKVMVRKKLSVGNNPPLSCTLCEAEQKHEDRKMSARLTQICSRT